MAIAQDSAIQFFGTQDTVTVAGGTAAVTNTSFSASSDVVSGNWTNDDDAPMAAVVLRFQYPSGTIVDDGIHLYYRLMSIDGANNEPQPTASHKVHYAGTFHTSVSQAATTNTYYPLTIALPNHQTSQVYQFYVENQCDVTMTAGWTLKVTPVTVGPHPA